jgi:tripartite-type tricarboxylate transporter receptor subunit TctC
MEFMKWPFVALFILNGFFIQEGKAKDIYPSHTVTVVVPYTPATGADQLSRVLAPRLAERWKVAVVTENRVGASGNIGAEFVAKAPPDGHTLLCTATAFGTNPALNRSLPFDPVASFAPVALLATSAMSLVVTPGLPAKSLREFIDAARREPGKFYYASPGNGTPQHLAMELLKLEAHIDVVNVPYKSSGGALADLVGGHVHAMVTSVQTAASNVRSGNLRMIAVMGNERSDAFPDVPTMKEQGYPDFVVETWYGLFAPAGTPQEVLLKLNSDFNDLLKDSQVRETIGRQGMIAAGGPPERLGELVKAELARWKRVVAAARIKAD